MVDDLSRAEVVAVIDRMVDELLDKARVQGPPVDAITLAQQHLGMEVFVDRGQGQRGRAQRTLGKKHIYLRPEPTEERRQWTVAHEIGEHLKANLLERLGMDPAQTKAMWGESLANLFAYHLLVPTLWFVDDAPGCEYDLLELKIKYRTSSHEVIAMRFLDLAEPCIVTVIDNEAIYRRKSNAWPARRKLEPAEEKCQRSVHKHGAPRLVRENGWTVQGWPVHQAEWKREILRSVVEDE